MKNTSRKCLLWIIKLVFVIICCDFVNQIQAQTSQTATCTSRTSRCFRKPITCPKQCPLLKPSDPKTKACYIDCRTCTAQCRRRLPNCNGYGSACYDPRFVGGDGIIFYFRGKSNQHFSLVSDSNLQINARFIGFRPHGRIHEYTWIQALGILFGSHNFSVEATKAVKWDDEVDHLKFTYDGIEVLLPQGHLSSWISPDKTIILDRTSKANSLILTLPNLMELAILIKAVTKQDDKIHYYHIPANDSFAHLEVQFKFLCPLSPHVEGVLGRTYQPRFVNPAKQGVPMPVVGGEREYKTTSLLVADCEKCSLFHPRNVVVDM